MNVALVEHTQNDVHRDQGCQNQQRLAGERGLESRRRSLKTGVMVGGKLIERCALLIAFVASPKETSGARLNDNVTEGY